jgi:hypothetical protein
VLIVLGVVIAVALVIIARGNELFRVSARDGKVLVVRGRVPAGLFAEMGEVCRKPLVRRATIRAVKTERGAELRFSGELDEGRQQRLRNCFALYPVSRLRAAPAIQDATLGQILGIAWLAWLLDRRARG